MKRPILLWLSYLDKSDRVGAKRFSKIIDPVEEIALSLEIPCVQVIGSEGGLSREEFWGGENLVVGKFGGKKSAGMYFQATWVRIKKALGLIERLISPEKLVDFRKLLKKHNPWLILGIEVPIEMISVAKKMGIKVVEILHGYGYSDTQLPSCLRGRPANLFPDEVISLDSNSFRTLEKKNGLKKVYLASHPLGDVLGIFTQSPIATEITKISTDFIPNDRPVVLISLTWGYFRDHPEAHAFDGILKNGIIHESVIEAIMKTEDEIFWLIRFHPVHLGNRGKYAPHFHLVSELQKNFGNVEWEKSSETPLYQILPKVNYHLTMRSETAYDAANFGIPTLLLCPRLNDGSKYEYFKDLIEIGTASLGDLDAGEIIKWLKAGKCSGTVKDPRKLKVIDILKSMIMEKSI